MEFTPPTQIDPIEEEEEEESDDGKEDITTTTTTTIMAKPTKLTYETTHFPCSQIFREKVPKELLVEFLNFVAPIKTEQHEYVVNTECFKRCQNDMAKATEYLQKFATYYYSSSNTM